MEADRPEYSDLLEYSGPDETVTIGDMVIPREIHEEVMLNFGMIPARRDAARRWLAAHAADRAKRCPAVQANELTLAELLKMCKVNVSEIGAECDRDGRPRRASTVTVIVNKDKKAAKERAKERAKRA